jgi:hypothetical protein
MGDLTITYGFFLPCNENRHRQYVFYGLKTVYVQSCGILTPYEIFLGYVGQINQLTLTQPAPLLHRADGAWLDMSLVSSATRKRWTNCFLRVIPTLQDYSDIASDVPSGSIYIYMAYLFWHFWHILWHSFWHSIWHLFWHSFLHSISYSFYSWGPAVPALAVEVRQCPQIWSSRLRDWDLEFAVGWRKDGKQRKGKERKEGNEGRKRRRK